MYMDRHNEVTGPVFEKPRGEKWVLFMFFALCGLCVFNGGYGDRTPKAIAGEVPITTEGVSDDLHTRMHSAERELARRDNLLVVCRNLDVERERRLSEIDAQWDRVVSGVENQHVPASVVSERAAQIYGANEYWKSQLVLAGCYDVRWDVR